MKTHNKLLLLLATTLTASVLDPGTAQAAERSYEFTIDISSQQACGSQVIGPWAGATIYGYVSYDDAAPIENADGSIYFEPTELGMVFPLGNAMTASQLTTMPQVYEDATGTIVLSGGMVSNPDSAVRSMWFDPGVDGVRYYYPNRSDDGSCQDRYVGTASYTPLVTDSDGDGLDDDVDACPLEDATGQDADADGCIDTVDAIANIVVGLELNSGTEGSLLASLDGAAASTETGNLTAAAGMLEAFVNKVEALRGKTLSDADADLLVTMAEFVAAGL